MTPGYAWPNASEAAKKIDEKTIKMTAKAGQGGRLFGSVTAKEIAEDFKANYDGASSVYVIKFLRPGFVYYTDASTEEVGTTLFHNKVDTRAVLQQMVSRQERAYFVLRLSDYRLLSEAEQKKLTVLSTRYEVLLLLKEGTL